MIDMIIVIIRYFMWWDESWFCHETNNIVVVVVEVVNLFEFTDIIVIYYDEWCSPAL